MKEESLHYRFEHKEKQRYYRLLLMQDLLGNWLVTKIWGGINKSGGRILHAPCLTYHEGIKMIATLSKKREQRGYQLIPAF